MHLRDELNSLKTLIYIKTVRQGYVIMNTTRQQVQQSFQRAQHNYQKKNLQTHTNYQKLIRGHNRYTNYNSYQKQGGKNWQAFKATR